MTLASARLRRVAIDALDDYASFMTADREQLEKRLANLRAALASIESRASTGTTPLCENIAMAARGALEADDRDASTREFQVSPEGRFRRSVDDRRLPGEAKKT